MGAKGAGFWKGAGIPKGKRARTFIECGCCGAYHRIDFDGDCREDSERYDELPKGARLIDPNEDEAYERAATHARGNDFAETGGKDWT